jgi:hypothetical protein
MESESPTKSHSRKAFARRDSDRLDCDPEFEAIFAAARRTMLRDTSKRLRGADTRTAARYGVVQVFTVDPTDRKLTQSGRSSRFPAFFFCDALGRLV